jgi:deoxyribose-phosphate aldolase
MVKITKKQLAKMIDHTNLKPNIDRYDISKLCLEAKKYGFYAVCVNPIHVSLAHELLRDTDVKVDSVVGFPLGYTLTKVKALETAKLIEDGANEIDMVINMIFLKQRNYAQVRNDIKAVVEAANGKIVKVILETCYLTDKQIIRACKLSKEAGAHFVKTSTGFGPSGAIIEHVKLMRETVGEEMGVKAAGGIRTFDDAIKMIEAGANRIGTSSGVEIIEGFK